MATDSATSPTDVDEEMQLAGFDPVPSVYQNPAYEPRSVPQYPGTRRQEHHYESLDVPTGVRMDRVSEDDVRRENQRHPKRDRHENNPPRRKHRRRDRRRR